MGPRLHNDETDTQQVIWTVRHGQRIDNIDKTWGATAPRGAWDDPTLSERGLQQARECGKRLQAETVDVILCSPFIRCVQTAYAIASAYPDSLPIFIEPGICESLHVCQTPPGYLSPYDLRKRFPLIDLSYEPIVEYPPPEENEISCEGRIQTVLTEAVRRYRGNLLLVSHGSPIAMIHEVLTGDWHYCGQCTISKFTASPKGHYRSIMKGDSSHLSDRTNLREREVQKPIL